MEWTNPYAAPEQPRFVTSILGSLERVTAPAGLVVSLDEAKANCRIEEDDEDALIQGLVQAATAFCEQEIDGHRQLLSATYDLPVERWWYGPLKLPRPPLQSVTSVKYYDTAGVQRTLATSVYLVRTPWRQPGTIELAPDQTWPAAQADRRQPITVRFVAGYASSVSVPATVKQAIKLLVAHWYENREATGQAGKEIEFAVRALLNAEGYGSYA